MVPFLNITAVYPRWNSPHLYLETQFLSQMYGPCFSTNKRITCRLYKAQILIYIRGHKKTPLERCVGREIILSSRQECEFYLCCQGLCIHVRVAAV